MISRRHYLWPMSGKKRCMERRESHFWKCRVNFNSSPKRQRMDRQELTFPLRCHVFSWCLGPRSFWLPSPGCCSSGSGGWELGCRLSLTRFRLGSSHPSAQAKGPMASGTPQEKSLRWEPQHPSMRSLFYCP